MRATAREAIEHVHGITAIEQLALPKLPGLPGAGAQTHGEFLGGDAASIIDSTPTEAVERNDDEARAFADTPHLTGDPEWDALELAETDPSKPPLQIQR